ncbi:hypothetical protein CAOG_02819 [Capsaspora owczarzaki ATCC 30864]|uniref:Uncharacterized protein n=1 Tax=Capsaspora owczarzaki (strain ATCC 30864) TaxID=595528 RepID=A0A0D2X206_CAPO3|nr:hypothetical protein CAOG_02819 [Capsaspora owczarzaki ATCC 30864]KJE91724.1 hypothetical protein CAOG_002819 [Capsaspora owczarzaki ATCC 30864]|eukprot:XP_004348632.2 hypothetical protein CAOG_02819 [Capsaspora owczarzaki ATCC 30864]
MDEEKQQPPSDVEMIELRKTSEMVHVDGFEDMNEDDYNYHLSHKGGPPFIARTRTRKVLNFFIYHRYGHRVPTLLELASLAIIAIGIYQLIFYFLANFTAHSSGAFPFSVTYGAQTKVRMFDIQPGAGNVDVMATLVNISYDGSATSQVIWEPYNGRDSVNTTSQYKENLTGLAVARGVIVTVCLLLFFLIDLITTVIFLYHTWRVAIRHFFRCVCFCCCKKKEKHILKQRPTYMHHFMRVGIQTTLLGIALYFAWTYPSDLLDNPIHRQIVYAERSPNCYSQVQRLVVIDPAGMSAYAKETSNNGVSTKLLFGTLPHECPLTRDLCSPADPLNCNYNIFSTNAVQRSIVVDLQIDSLALGLPALFIDVFITVVTFVKFRDWKRKVRYHEYTVGVAKLEMLNDPATARKVFNFAIPYPAAAAQAMGHPAYVVNQSAPAYVGTYKFIPGAVKAYRDSVALEASQPPPPRYSQLAMSQSQSLKPSMQPTQGSSSVVGLGPAGSLTRSKLIESERAAESERQAKLQEEQQRLHERQQQEAQEQRQREQQEQEAELERQRQQEEQEALLERERKEALEQQEQALREAAEAHQAALEQQRAQQAALEQQQQEAQLVQQQEAQLVQRPSLNPPEIILEAVDDDSVPEPQEDVLETVEPAQTVDPVDPVEVPETIETPETVETVESVDPVTVQTIDENTSSSSSSETTSAAMPDDMPVISADQDVSSVEEQQKDE